MIRDVDHALGTLATYTSALGGEITLYHDEESQRYADIDHRSNLFTVVEAETGSFLMINATRKLTNIDDFDIRRSVPVDEAEDAIGAVINDAVVDEALINLVTAEHDGVQYFDGYRSNRPVFPLEDGFGIHEFDSVLGETDSEALELFIETTDRLGIERTGGAADATAAEESGQQLDSGPAFQ